MLDGLMGRGFTVKCKSLIKTTRSRIDVVRRRAEAKQRFLKEDLAKLLSNGLDINAYGRTEEYIAGMNLLFCYDFIEQSCEYIVKKLSRMQKQGECPEECKEAVESLMFAAARFSDLPELRDLRDTFQDRYGNGSEAFVRDTCQDRYGNGLEPFVNQKFVEKLSSKTPASEKRLRVLQDIAAEFSIKWDSKGFDQRLAAPPVVSQAEGHKADMVVKRRQGLVDEKSRVLSYGEGYMGSRGEADYHRVRTKDVTRLREQPLLKRGGSSSRGEKDDFPGHTITENKHSYAVEKGGRELKVERSGSSSHGKLLDKGHTGYTRSSNGIPNAKKRENRDELFHEKVELAPALLEYVGKQEKLVSRNESSPHGSTEDSVESKTEEGSSRLKAVPKHTLPPPYVKSKDKVARPPYVKPNEDKLRHYKGSILPRSCPNDHVVDPASSTNGSSMVNSSGGSNNKPDYHDHEEHLVGAAKIKSNGHVKDFDVEEEQIPLPRPRSLCRKHHKSSSSNDDVGTTEDIRIANRSSSSSRRSDHSRRGLQILFDEEHHRKDDEERMIDKLLIHYSKKPSSYDEVGKLRRRERLAGGKHHMIADGSSKHKVLQPPTRSVSLPHEQQTASPESVKVFNRANSFQPENQARHVHPKLPDYDDLAAKFAALKGR